MGFLIDTCIWIDVEQGRLGPADVAAFTGDAPVYLCPVTLAELRLGESHRFRCRRHQGEREQHRPVEAVVGRALRRPDDRRRGLDAADLADDVQRPYPLPVPGLRRRQRLMELGQGRFAEAEVFHAAGAARGGSGVIVLPCGAGKTIVGMATMAEIGASTLILTTGVTAPGETTANLIGANVAGGAAGQSADLLNDLKVGHLVGAPAQWQVIAQFFGILTGSVVGSLVYLLGTAAFALPGNHLAYASMLLFAAGMFTLHSVLSAFLNHLETERKGLINGLYVSAYYTGGALGSYLPGFLYLGFGWSSFIAFLLLLLCGLTALSLALRHAPQASETG